MLHASCHELALLFANDYRRRVADAVSSSVITAASLGNVARVTPCADPVVSATAIAKALLLHTSCHVLTLSQARLPSPNCRRQQHHPRSGFGTAARVAPRADVVVRAKAIVGALPPPFVQQHHTKVLKRRSCR